MKAPTKKPAKRCPTVIRAGELYSLAELRRRLGWAEASVRQARIAGLKLVSFGRQKFVLGKDVLDFFERLKTKQGGAAL